MDVIKATDDARGLFGRSLEALYQVIRSRETPKNAFTSTLGSLVWFADERGESILRLIRSGCLWDADIISRCFNEAYVKFLFLCFANDSEREASVNEFTNDLWLVHDLRTAERSDELLSMKDISSEFARALKPLIRPDVEIAKLKEVYPSRRRDSLLKKWSFPHMVAEVSRFFEQTYGLEGFVSMIHQYGLISHFVHADETALGMMWDRSNRQPEEGQKLRVAHAARILSDLVWQMYMMRSGLAHTFKQQFPDEAARAYYDELQRYSASLRNAEHGFWQTQAAPYPNKP